MNSDILGRWFPGAALAFATLYLVFTLMPPASREGKMDLYEFSKIPVVDGGRVKPLDTVARNSLMVVSNRQTYYNHEDEKASSFPRKRPAIEWLLDAMTSRLSGKESPALKNKVFRIENEQVLGMLGLKPRPGLRYSGEEFADKVPKLQAEAERARKLRKQSPRQMELYDTKVLEFADHLQLYVNLSTLEAPLAVPPRDADDEWQSFIQAFGEIRDTGENNPGAKAMADILVAYMEGNADKFNRDVTDYRQKLREQLPAESRAADFETAFNHFEPFYQCSLLYGLVFVLSCCAWIGWSGPLNRAAFWITILALAVDAAALVGRMYLMDRWLVWVTNLYSSAVFIGFGGVILGVILELIYRNGVGNLLAAVLGFPTLIIAHNLAAGGDTLEMMQAVLDTNFWLATHVTCITLGYTATFAAGALGSLFILLGVFSHRLDDKMFKASSQMTYGVVCFATFLSFIGTVLGGIWADQSWGRFWGWDPKENGALIIVLMNALVLHARWGGVVKQRGIAVLAVAGNIVTAWSWFGVNMLGVGLHSYGFMEGAFFWLLTYAGSQVALMGIGMLPLRFWKSYGTATAGRQRIPRRPRMTQPVQGDAKRVCFIL